MEDSANQELDIADDIDNESSTGSEAGSDCSTVTTNYEDETLYNDNYQDLYGDDSNELEMIGSFQVHPSNDVKISCDGADNLLLSRAKVEFKTVIQKVEVVCQKPNPTPMELVEVFFPKSTRSTLLSWVTDYSLDTQTMPLTDIDVLSFIRLDLKAQYHHTSISHMFLPSQQKHYQLGDYMNERKYHYIMRALNNGRRKKPPGATTWNPPIHRNNEIISLFEEYGKNCARKCFVSGVSMIALDDDLWRHRSKKIVVDDVMQINNPKKGMGVVHHAAVSVCTGLYCGGYVQHRGDTTANCVDNVQRILCQAIQTSAIDLNGTTFYMDRGYGGTDGEIISTLIQRGGNIHGTAKRMQSYPYTHGTARVHANQRLIQEYGAYAQYCQTIVRIDSSHQC